MFGMDTMTFNKIAGALLGSALLVMGLNIVAEAVYHAERPESTAINIEVPEAEGLALLPNPEHRKYRLPAC